jgi:regulatory protein
VILASPSRIPEGGTIPQESGASALVAEASPPAHAGRMRRPAKRESLGTEAGLFEAATAYLERHVTSREHLRRLLRRKAARALGEAADREALAPAIERVLDRLERAGALNDEVYAALRARALHRRGLPGRAIAHRLAQKGIEAGTVQGAVAGLEDEAVDPDWVAACRFARRRRLGPFRAEARAERREKDLAAMARAGFSFELARRVIDAGDVEAILELLRAHAR